jgi:hypothetical protein
MAVWNPPEVAADRATAASRDLSTSALDCQRNLFSVGGILATAFLGMAAVGARQLAGGEHGPFVGAFRIAVWGAIALVVLFMFAAGGRQGKR